MSYWDFRHGSYKCRINRRPLLNVFCTTKIDEDRFHFSLSDYRPLFPASSVLEEKTMCCRNGRHLIFDDSQFSFYQMMGRSCNLKPFKEEI